MSSVAIKRQHTEKGYGARGERGRGSEESQLKPATVSNELHRMRDRCQSHFHCHCLCLGTGSHSVALPPSLAPSLLPHHSSIHLLLLFLVLWPRRRGKKNFAKLI